MTKIEPVRNSENMESAFNKIFWTELYISKLLCKGITYQFCYVKDKRRTSKYEKL